MTATPTQETNTPMPAPLRTTAITVQDRQMAAPARIWRRLVIRFVILALLWGVLTEFRLDGLVFGLPAVLAATALSLMLPLAPGWRLSPVAALHFAGWFALASVRGAVDVAWRAFQPRMTLRPGFRPYETALPEGAPRVMFLNTITLLPGTLSAQIAGTEVIVHMLDTRADLEADLADLEARIAALFALDLSAKD